MLSSHRGKAVLAKQKTCFSHGQKEPFAECAKRIAAYAGLGAMVCLLPLANAQTADTPKAAESAAKPKPSLIKLLFFKAAFDIESNIGDLKVLQDKGPDGADYTYLKSLFEALEGGRLNLEGIDAADLTDGVKKEVSKVLKAVDLRTRDFGVLLEAEKGENGAISVSLLSRGANSKSDRFYVSEMTIPKDCEVLRCEPFSVRTTNDVAEAGAYLKYVDKRDGKTYQLIMRVTYSRTSLGLAKTSFAFRQLNDNEIGVAVYTNRQIGTGQ
jgi:hypothetical protein